MKYQNKKGYETFLNEVLILNKKFTAADRYYERLIWHEGNFEKTLKGDFLDIKPITADFIMNNECNYFCSGCTFNYVRQQQSSIKGRKSMKKKDIPILIDRLSDAGLKALIFSGGGEPTLHKYLVYAMGYASKKGMDTALYSNGSYKDEDLSKKLIDLSPKYIRISLNGDRNIHKEFHGTKKDYYEQCIKNIQNLSKANDKFGNKTTLGVSFLINETNSEDMNIIVNALTDIFQKDVMLDYITIKPQINYRNPKNQLDIDIIRKINSFVDSNKEKIEDKFNLGVFYNTFFTEKMFSSTNLNSPCNSHGWVANVDWQGNISFCVEFAMDDRYIIGNLINQNFDEIWNGNKRKQMHEIINNNIEKCPQVCRNRVKNHLIDLLDFPYNHEKISQIMDNIKKHKKNNIEPNHINFL